MTMPFPSYASIKGKRIGKTTSDVLVATEGAYFGKHNVVEWYDDFLGDAIDARWGVAKGSDAAAVDFAHLTGTRGMIQATTGAGAGASMAANGVQLHQALQWKANQGNLAFETMLKVSAITTIALFVGFTDQIGSLEMPIHAAGSANTITTNATDAAGLFFDTSMTDDNFWVAGVKNDTDGTHVNTSIAPVADTWIRLGVELDSSGNAIGYINGVNVGAVANAVTATVALTPVIACFRRAASSATIQVDYINVIASRA